MVAGTSGSGGKDQSSTHDRCAQCHFGHVVPVPACPFACFLATLVFTRCAHHICSVPFRNCAAKCSYDTRTWSLEFAAPSGSTRSCLFEENLELPVRMTTDFPPWIYLFRSIFPVQGGHLKLQFGFLPRICRAGQDPNCLDCLHRPGVVWPITYPGGASNNIPVNPYRYRWC